MKQSLIFFIGEGISFWTKFIEGLQKEHSRILLLNRCSLFFGIICKYFSIMWFVGLFSGFVGTFRTRKFSVMGTTTCTFPIIRRHSVYCLVDEFWQGSFCPRRRKKIKNKISYLACIRGKNKKDVLKLVFYHENRQIQHNLSTF